MKKYISLVLSLLMIMTLSVDVFAAEKMQDEYIEILAYSNAETADVATKEKILAAREQMIFNQTWVADGLKAVILDSEGNVESVVPEFHDLFPEDWDIPTMSLPMNEDNNLFEVAFPFTSRAVMPSFDDEVELEQSTGSSDASPFYYTPSTWNGITLTRITTQGFYGTVYDATYNVGYSNYSNGRSLGYATRLPSGRAFSLQDVPANTRIAVRASTYDTPGYWTMTVTGQY